MKAGEPIVKPNNERWKIGSISAHEETTAPVPEAVRATKSLVASVARRYLGNSITASRVEMALALQQPMQINHFQEGSQFDLSASVTLEERFALERIATESAEKKDESEEYSAAKIAALFERLFSRRIRLASSIPIECSWHNTINTAPAPINKRRSELPESFAPQGKTQSDSFHQLPAFTRDVGWGTPAAFPEHAKPATLPPPEIKRVTDQVMREIDRRIVARRERMGGR
jgi:hypothetical protein